MKRAIGKTAPKSYTSRPVPLPSGLSRYEFRRSLVASSDLDRYFHLQVEKDERGVPRLLPEGMPSYRPLDLQAFFGAAPPFEIEIGCGKGGFMVDYCEKHPDIPFLGVEWEAEIAFLAASRIAKRPHLPHARVLLGDAFFLFRDFLPEGCVSAFHMYFPDPWPKKRQRKNRLARLEFLHQVKRVARAGALFHWATDHAEYDGETRDLFASLPWLTLERDEAEPTEGIMTNFERKYRLEGRPIYRRIYRIR